MTNHRNKHLTTVMVVTEPTLLDKSKAYIEVLKRKKMIVEVKNDCYGVQVAPILRKGMNQRNTVKVYKIQKLGLLSEDEKRVVLDSILVDSKATLLSKMERKILGRRCKYSIPNKYRRLLWMRASGAYALLD